MCEIINYYVARLWYKALAWNHSSNLQVLVRTHSLVTKHLKHSETASSQRLFKVLVCDLMQYPGYSYLRDVHTEGFHCRGTVAVR